MQLSRSPMEEVEEEQEGMTFDELSMTHSTHFLNALQELRDLKPQLYFAADYCENSFLHNQHKRQVLENTKDYTVKALVNTVDHLGNVASQLDGFLSQEAVEIASTEVRINSLKQRVLTCREYTDGKALRQQCLVQTFPRHHKHYIMPETVFPNSGSVKESYMGLGNEQARPQQQHSGVTQGLSTLNSNHPFSNEVHKMTFSASAHKTSALPEIKASFPSTSVTSSCSQSATGTPMTPTSSHSFGSVWKDDGEASKSTFSFGNNYKKTVHRPTRSKGFLPSFLNHKSIKKRSNDVW